MENGLDYFNNPELLRHIAKLTVHIKNPEDMEDCRQDIWAELYDFMPLDDDEAKKLITRVVKKFEWRMNNMLAHEVSLDDM